jgi:tetratricopeptide (TPR) repeat protein
VRHASDSAATERDLQLYAAAHRLHFQSNDSFAALKAWSEYLTQVPNGRFVVEARYNRAICLVRLGRKREALDALQPFVSGAYGNYRRTEASALMEQLSQEQ